MHIDCTKFTETFKFTNNRPLKQDTIFDGIESI